MQSCNYSLSKHSTASAKNTNVFLFSILLYSMISLIITMLSIVDLCFLPVVCISDILLCLVLLFFFFFYFLHLLWTQYLLKIVPSDFCLAPHHFLFYQLILLWLVATIIFSCSILRYNISRLFITSSPSSIHHSAFHPTLSPAFIFFIVDIAFLTIINVIFSLLLSFFLFHYTFKLFLHSFFCNCLPMFSGFLVVRSCL